MKKRNLACLFVVFFAVFVVVATSHAETLNRIVATVDGEPLTLRELEEFSEKMGDRAAMMHPQGAAGMTQRDFMDALIMNKMIRHEVETQGLSAKAEDLDSYIQRIKDQGGLDDAQLEEALAEQGMSMEAYRQQIREEIERALLVNREIGSKVNVTPQDVQRYIDSNSKEFDTPDQIRIRHIFLPLPPAAPEEAEKHVIGLIEDIHTRAAGGEDFAALATEYSLGPGAEQGGDLGFFEKGQMAYEIEDVAFSLKEGEISQPFRTDTGAHLIKVEEIRISGTDVSDATREEIRRRLYDERLAERYRSWFQDDLRFRHHVESFLTSRTGTPYTGIRRAEDAFGDANQEAVYTEDIEDDEKSYAADEEEETTQVAASKEEKGFFGSLFSGDDEEEKAEAEEEIAAQDEEDSEDEDKEGGFLGLF